MGKDFYATLKISRGANKQELQAGFKQAVLRWHPNLTKQDKVAALENFNKACEAYEVLSNDITRSVYDMFGHEALAGGITVDQNIVFPAYQYSNNYTKVYEKFILESSPFASIIDFDGSACRGSIFGMGPLGLNWERDTSPVHVSETVKCSLEELYNGCQKTVVYLRRVFNEDKRTTRQVEERKEILIEKGLESGAQLIVKSGGSDKMGCNRGDLIVKIEELKHERFERRGNDLYVTMTLSLLEALDARFVKIVSLDGRKLKMSFDQAVTPNLVLTIENEGMPEVGGGRGRMFVAFDIQLPNKVLPPAASQVLKSCLPS